jgi:hypothetical protein
MAFLKDVEREGIEFHSFMLSRGRSVIAEGC